MPLAFHLDFAAATDTGLQREHNEDAIAVSAENGLAIIADGMGGYKAGEVASAMAVFSLRTVLDDLIPGYEGRARGRQIRRLLSDAVEHSNKIIHDAASAQPEFAGMATTLAMAVFHRRVVTLAHVGDSRIYRWRAGELQQLTRDHSEVQEQIDRGLISPGLARFALNRNIVTRGLGVTDSIDVDVASHRVEAGDLYLLCSDGLTDLLDDGDIAVILRNTRDDLKSSCDALVAQANEFGGKDNISVVLARASNDSEAGGVVGKMLGWMK
ncbi:MAG: Stp1/IreP family PP2C-type Ser/Thr phosphatase [Janthinobacterium lividum]